MVGRANNSGVDSENAFTVSNAGGGHKNETLETLGEKMEPCLEDFFAWHLAPKSQLTNFQSIDAQNTHLVFTTLS